LSRINNAKLHQEGVSNAAVMMDSNSIGGLQKKEGRKEKLKLPALRAVKPSFSTPRRNREKGVRRQNLRAVGGLLLKGGGVGCQGFTLGLGSLLQ